MGFGNDLVRRIMNCLFFFTTSLSFKINGKIAGAVNPTRRLRQGDPMSPNLLLLCADVFSTLISKAALEKKIYGAKIYRNAPNVSNLFFVHDSILLLRANLTECSMVVDIIRKYKRASGQKVNLNKTEVVFSKCVPVNRKIKIINTLGVREVEKHKKYLGLPTIIEIIYKKIVCLKEGKWKKASGVEVKLLSYPGKEILVKTVAQAIPTYMMNIFMIPNTLIEKIQLLLNRFWWGSDNSVCKFY